MAYPFQEIEGKWQAAWQKDGTYAAKDLPPAEKSKKFYGLVEFPYPSGEGLHVGHPRSYTAIDIVTRKRRMDGKDVLYPIGWDAFGLPAENYAIKTKTQPAVTTAKNIANFKRQIMSLGVGFDWSREINTTDPKYYKWTQWMFLKFFNAYFDEVEGRAKPIEELAVPAAVSAQGEAAMRDFVDGTRLAYKAASTVNWCPRCNTGLANEEAQGGVCERCGSPVEERQKMQWMLRITKYADRLIRELDGVDYLERIKSQQIHWIGKSEGAYVDFVLESWKRPLPDRLTVFTTRPDTLFGATFVVMAPEHPLVKTWLAEGDVQNADEVKAYVDGSAQTSERERQETDDKTGVALTGVRAKNPATGEWVPVWVANYVLPQYGTGAIMAVAAHDARDFAFAETHKLPIKQVVADPSGSGLTGLPYEGEGTMFASGFLDGLTSADARVKMIAWLEAGSLGERRVMYRLRDWVFSRQRYWGEPIPIVICPDCGYVPVPESELPLKLPEVENYEPTANGESPLAAIRSFVETTCPHCGKPARRETDTMPNWAGSSWYFLRYCDPHNDTAFADPEKLKFWMPVDLYNGGMEHTTLHLLYSRFWYKVLFDLDLIPRECGNEPYLKRRSHALIMGEGGIKMSKSKGNVVNPDDIVKVYGADVFRTYEMFIGPYDADAPWDTNGIEGVKRFLDKAWRIYEKVESGTLKVERQDKAFETILHQTIKKVGEDIEALHFNTAVSAMMILVNEIGDAQLDTFAAESFLKLLAPFAPHLAEELWNKLGHTDSIHLSAWPTYDPAKIVASSFELVIQVNGKVRDKVTVASDISEDEAKARAMASEKVKPYLEGKEPQKVVYVKGRLVSISV